MDAVEAGKEHTVTDAYRSIITNYTTGINSRKDLYMKVVMSIHEYYQRHNKFSAVFGDFEDRFLEKFIPPEYYKDFTSAIKDNTLHAIIIYTVNNFATFILEQKILQQIIDNHKNKLNINILQDKIVDIFALKRENYYAKFAREIIGKGHNNTVSSDVLHRLKEEFVKEKKLRLTLEGERDKALNMIQQLVSVLEKKDYQIADLENRCISLGRQTQYTTPAQPIKPPVIHYSKEPQVSKEPVFVLSSMTTTPDLDIEEIEEDLPEDKTLESAEDIVDLKASTKTLSSMFDDEEDPGFGH
jgi:hypothetical protein